MTTQTVYLLVFDGLADWEPAHALCEINNSGKFVVETVGFSTRPVKTMGGVTILPDITLEQVELAEAALFILPGGTMWEAGPRVELHGLLHQFHEHGVPIGAVCAATLEIARTGLTHNVRHTSNDLAYLQIMVPEYEDAAFYVSEFAVADQNMITANGLGSVEFARAVIKELGIYSDEGAEAWYEMFKHGRYVETVA